MDEQGERVANASLQQSILPHYSPAQIMSSPAPTVVQGGAGLAKNDRGSFFLETAWSSGLTNYVIRGISIFRSNITMYGLIDYITRESAR